MNKPGFYLLLLEGGTEMTEAGPFTSLSKRLDAAKSEWLMMDPSDGDNIFWADVNVDGVLSAGSFEEGDLDSDEDDEDNETE